MPTPDKFCLRWNDFHEYVKNAFSTLRKDSNFTDVTLACQDGYQVEAHKVILAASSPFFQNLLKRNKHAYTLVYMRGIHAEVLLAIVDFLYYGEANINQEHLDSFLNIAEELELKGLNDVEGVGGGEEEREDISAPSKQINQLTSPSPCTQKKSVKFDTKIDSQESSFLSQFFSDDKITSSMAVALPNLSFSGDMKVLDEQIETMIDRGENKTRHGLIYICKVCG